MGLFSGKKLLVLGGKPIGSCEIVTYAQNEGAYVIVADYLSENLSAAKRIADECLDVSTADVDFFVDYIKKNGIDGVYTGVHEFNIGKMIEICEKTHLPCFCNKEQWDNLNNKEFFKGMCRKYDIPVTKVFSLQEPLNEDDLRKIEYPIIVKPVDGSGSRGFAICNNSEDIITYYPKAKSFSPTRRVLVEKYMNYKNSVIINYTLVDGKIYYSGIGDKSSEKVFESGAPIMSSVIYPSKYEKEYLKDLNSKAEKMFVGEGYKNGVIWIEAFCDNGKFTFNEAGYRFGGSLTYYPVNYLYSIDQLKLQIEFALCGKNSFVLMDNPKNNLDDIYVVFPVHVKPGIIKTINGIEDIKKFKELKKIVYVHYLGDTIEAWGSAQQVFAYMHYIVKDRNEAVEFAKKIVTTVKVLDESNNQMLFNLFVKG